ncbi:MAG: hypothetical protein NTY66_02120 [Candidatus Vogelbacteria bacterium]|nr:hypothetical protein [Candidatus Vogelbacteria bacterium]
MIIKEEGNNNMSPVTVDNSLRELAYCQAKEMSRIGQEQGMLPPPFETVKIHLAPRETPVAGSFCKLEFPDVPFDVHLVV